jgi:hypothetical protein
MDFKTILAKIEELNTETLTEATKETKTGRVHKGKYGTAYQPDEKRDEYGHRVKGTKEGPEIDGEEEQAPTKRGRGRPSKTGEHSTAGKEKLAKNKLASDTLAAVMIGKKPTSSKKLDKLPSSKHKLKDWVEHIESSMIQEAANTPFGTPGGKSTVAPDDVVPVVDKDGKTVALQQQVKEKKMSSSDKRREKKLKSKYDKSDMKNSMKKQYGDKKGEKVYFATIRKQAMAESVLKEGYQLEEILSKFPHEHKNCQEGHPMDEAMFEALRDHYFESGRIPRAIREGDREDLKSWVHECYTEDIGHPINEIDHDMRLEDDLHEVHDEPVFYEGKDMNEEKKSYDLPPGTRGRNKPTLKSLGDHPKGDSLVDQQQKNREAAKDNLGYLEPTASGYNVFTPQQAEQKKREAAKNKIQSVSESAEFKAWDAALTKMLNEGLTITTSTGQEGTAYGGMGGSGDSVSVNATGEDAKEMMALLRNSGIGQRSIAGDTADKSADAEHGGISVSDPSGVMSGLSQDSEVENGDSILSFIKKMVGSDDVEAVKTDDRDDDVLHTNDESETEKEEDKTKADEGNAFIKARNDAEEQGKSSFKMGDTEYPVKEEDESDESEEKKEVEEGHQQCNECGAALEEGHECSKEQVNEWANTAQNKLQDEQFTTDIDYMIRMISGGLNGQKKNQTVLPTNNVEVDTQENVHDIKRLAGLK